MADLKISELTNLTAADPANDMIPIVDVSATPPASGSTKRISINNILACSPTATLASATITGDLTVRTNKLSVTSTNVGIGTASPTLAAGVGLEIENAGITTLRLQNTSGANAFELQVDSDANGVLYRGYNNSPHVFYVNNSTAMTLNANGLGVGGAPLSGFRLNVNNGDLRVSDVQNEDGVEIGWSAGAGSGFVQVYNRTTSVFKDLVLNNAVTINTAGNVGVGVTPTVGKVQTNGAFVTTGAVGSLGTNPLGNALIADFSTTTRLIATGANTTTAGVFKFINASSNASVYLESMTLDASGNLLVGTTTTSGNAGGLKLSNVGGTLGQITFSNNSGVADYVARFNYGSTPTLVGTITVASGGTTYNTTSDYRLKESVQPLVGGLARVSALKPSIYKWKSDGSSGEGFLAHELAEVVPFAVTGEKDAVNEDGSVKAQGVDLSRVVPILVAAIQELTARVQTLETR